MGLFYFYTLFEWIVHGKEKLFENKFKKRDYNKQTEVAKKLNLSYSATKSRIQRGRKLLKEQLANCDPNTIVFGSDACKNKRRM